MTELEKAAQKNGPEVELYEQMQRAQARVRLLKPDDFDAPELDLSDSHTALFALAEYWKGKYGKLKALTQRPASTYTAPAPAVPSGWSITDNGDNSITVHGPGLGCTVSDVEEVARRVPSEVLYEFCRAMLTAAPTPPAQSEPDQFVDANKMVAPVALSSVRLTRDTAGMCIVSVNGRVAIRDNGDIIDHIATLEWFAGSQPAVPEDVARDAERYRWLREQDNDDFCFAVVKNPHFDVYEPGADLDAAIDAALSSEKEPTK